ncbi:hypothetical protein DW799_13150 [Blautia obeum]|jgi:hypothetical protein|nr:hypothetical protein DW799_13150 [Blautia obeum]
MILPDKNIKLEYSLLNCGALVLESLEVPLTISALWEKLKEQKVFVGYEKFILTIDFLYMINGIENENGLIRRCDI